MNLENTDKNENKNEDREKNENKDKNEVVICNGCGRRIRPNETLPYADYFHVEKKWGYGSLLDGQLIEADLCEECFQKMIDQMKIDPKRSY